MKHKINFLIIFSFMTFLVVFSCKDKAKNGLNSDTILEGTTNILVDETLFPIVEDQVQVFQSQYKATINLISKSEKEAVNDLLKGNERIIILPRDLSKNELTYFTNKKINPRSTPFAIDAITFIKNKNSNDTLLSVQEVTDFLKGSNNKIKGLVFDNPNSSTVSYICKMAGIKSLPTQNIFSFKTNEEVIKYVSENDGMIGVVGINWITQPKATLQKYIDNINLMSVKGNDNQYVYPTQENIGSRQYPLARVLYSINCQGYSGLGMGFSSFIAGEIGQRILVQSGLAPIREPSRNIRTRKEIEKKINTNTK